MIDVLFAVLVPLGIIVTLVTQYLSNRSACRRAEEWEQIAKRWQQVAIEYREMLDELTAQPGVQP